MDTSKHEVWQNVIWKRNLYTCWAVRCVISSGYQFLIPFTPILFQEMGVSDANLGLVSGLAIAAPGFFVGIAAPFWGYMADVFGHRIMIMRAIVMSGILFFLFSIVSTPGMFVTFRILQGLFTGIIASSIALISASTPHRYQNKAFRMLATSNLLTSTFVPSISGPIVLAIGISISLRVGAIVTFIVGICAMFLIKNPIVKEDRENMMKKRREDKKSGIKVMYVSQQHKVVLLGTLIISALLNLMRISLITLTLLTIVKFTQRKDHEVLSGISVAGMGMWGLVSTYVIPLISTKSSKSRFSISAIITGIFIIVEVVILLISPIIGYVSYIILFALSLGVSIGIEIIMQEVVGKISYNEHKGKVFGTMTLLGGMGRFFGTMLLSGISGWLGMLAASITVVILLCIIFFLLLYIRTKENSSNIENIAHPI